MIKINLLQDHKKAKKTPPGQSQVAVGLIGLLAIFGGVYYFVQMPYADKVAKLQRANADMKRANDKTRADMQDFDAVKQQADAVKVQGDAIKRLNDAKVVPAWFLHELSRILTKGQKPTMTTEMQSRLSGVLADKNRQFDDTWNPNSLWIETLEEKDGTFTLQGGAQSDSDVTQFALRLQSSVYFQGVVPEGGDTVEDQKTHAKYYHFTITGKVVY
jgi:Tfp pilus assembly protein PilN